MTAHPNAFEWRLRAYFADTDAGGVVHHGAYIRFLEAARIEWMRDRLGLGARTAETDGVVFAVHRLSLDYLRPARLDDELVVTVQVERVRQTGLVCRQTVRRDADVLVQAEVGLVCVAAADFRPARVPPRILSTIQPESAL